MDTLACRSLRSPCRDTSRTGTKQQQLLAAVAFLRKPAIACKPIGAVEEYLVRNGVPLEVVRAARGVVDGSLALADAHFAEEPPVVPSPGPDAPKTDAERTAPAHAPRFVGDFDSAGADSAIDDVQSDSRWFLSLVVTVSRRVTDRARA